jgi:asparagine synthase (glutamine-hydrolysing)
VSGAALTPLDIACGVPLGVVPVLALPAGDAPRDALERAILPALRHGPCLVSFSGGRDSSAVLALAAAVARREGLPPPIPATVRTGAAPGADESPWQERVIAHLGLRDWLRIEVADELDAVGPIAAEALRRHGLQWPFNAHFHVPLLRAARGGSLLTGIGGDELFAAAAARRRPRGALRRAFQVAPAPARRAVLARRRPMPLPWLTPSGRRRANRAAAAEEAAQPRALAGRLAWWRSLRYLEVGQAALGRLAADEEVLLGHPLLDRAAWGAVGTAAPPGGFAGRTSAMRALFGDLLPEPVVARTDKAAFEDVFVRGHTRAFAAAWDGSGVPGDLVDPARLAAAWAAPAPAAQSLTALQAAWLAHDRSAGDGGQQPLAGSVR